MPCFKLPYQINDLAFMIYEIDYRTETGKTKTGTGTRIGTETTIETGTGMTTGTGTGMTIGTGTGMTIGTGTGMTTGTGMMTVTGTVKTELRFKVFPVNYFLSPLKSSLLSTNFGIYETPIFLQNLFRRFNIHLRQSSSIIYENWFSHLTFLFFQ